jgi:hypothetical protein
MTDEEGAKKIEGLVSTADKGVKLAQTHSLMGSFIAPFSKEVCVVLLLMKANDVACVCVCVCVCCVCDCSWSHIATQCCGTCSVWETAT